MLTRGGRGDRDNFPKKAKWQKEKFFFAQVELIMHRSGDEDEDAEPENCAAPLTCKEKVFRERVDRYIRYIDIFELQGEGFQRESRFYIFIVFQDLLRYYYYIHNGIATKYVAGMSQEWFQRIMNLVPK